MMNRFNRRLMFILVPVIVLAMVLGAFLNFSTSRALSRAEAFQFRRMLVTQQGEEGEYRFFFVTNRSVEQADGAYTERFGNQREALTFGLFDTEIEPSLGIGMIVDPSDWFQNEESSGNQIRPENVRKYYQS